MSTIQTVDWTPQFKVGDEVQIRNPHHDWNNGLKKIAKVILHRQRYVLAGDSRETSWPESALKPYTLASEPTPWILPPPPTGQQWHRTDGWTKEMLPEGWRPLLINEKPNTADFYFFAGDEWIQVGTPHVAYHEGAKPTHFHIRTRRPLPQSAEPVVEEKSALTQYWQDTAEANLKEAGRERTRAEQAESERDQLRKELEDWRSDRKASSAAFRAHIKSTTAENAALKENLEAATHLVRRAVYAAEHLRDLSRCPGMVEWLKNADAFLGAQESPPETEEQAMRREFEAWYRNHINDNLPKVFTFGHQKLAWLAWQAAKQSNTHSP